MNSESMSEEVRGEIERILIELSKTNFDSRRIKVGVLSGGVLGLIRDLQPESPSNHEINHRLCDCLNCRLGKHDQCQTFNPSKKGKRK